MKILQINTSDLIGGAARAAYRLHKSLQYAGVKSTMLVQTKKSDDPTVCGESNNTDKLGAIFNPIVDAVPTFLYSHRSSELFSVAWQPSVRLINKINNSDTDLVHLHWIYDGMLSINGLLSIKKPLVWSLHDMWPFTGGCHYDGGCGRYLDLCCHCPALGSKSGYDLSTNRFNVKKKTFLRMNNLTIIGVSRWLSDCAKKSHLLGTKTITSLPNPIDTNIFAPVDRTVARELLNLPLNKKLVLFGAIKATHDRRKGYTELIGALKHLNIEAGFELIVFGCSHPGDQPVSGHKSHYLGHLYDDTTLKLLYSAADVMIVPSLQENLSNIIMESMACGTPVVAFDTGGNADLIDHQTNGYLAKPFEPVDLAAGTRWALESNDYKQLSGSAREKVVRCFDSKVVAAQYMHLYEQILNKESASA